MASEEWSEEDRVEQYLAAAGGFPHRSEGEGVLLDHVPGNARRILDLGTGDGRTLALLSIGRPGMSGVGLEISEPMLRSARKRFEGDSRFELISHDLDEPLPDVGSFDAVVSSFAIHHLED
ncbi:class I SAM-dependent methyltransferase, partial [Spirulina sp. 06S082]|uniref:class I SAM-dependent methyltransferase n=1 Tax=Spirulina sp. 06S082 TaxID=3110248 RepID=UPI002B1F2087